MRKIVNVRLFRSLMAAALMVGCFHLLSAQEHTNSNTQHWTYSGKQGPKYWGGLDRRTILETKD